MAYQDNERAFRLNLGINTYDPAFTSETLQLQELRNLEPNFNRLKASTKQVTLQRIQGNECGPWGVVSFADYVEPTLPSVQIYGFTNFQPFQYKAELVGNGKFVPMIDTKTDEVYKFPFANGDPFASAQFGEGLYITRFGEDVAFIQNNEYTPVVTDFETSLQARYMINSNRHIMVANTIENGSKCTLRVRWSDLNNPNVMTVLASNEADFFDIDAGDGFITGLSRQRGFVYVYANSAIWVGRYTPGRTIAGGISASYLFEELFTEFGCMFHYSQIQAKEVDYFFGSDNIYSLVGQQLVPIGNPIWQYFLETQDDIGFNQDVFGHVDELNNQVYWQYLTNLPGQKWNQIVFNYKEGKWTTRDPQNAFAAWLPRIKPRISIPIDSWDCPEYPSVNDFDATRSEVQKGVAWDIDLLAPNRAKITKTDHGLAVNQKMVLSESSDEVKLQNKATIVLDVIDSDNFNIGIDDTTVGSGTITYSVVGEVLDLTYLNATFAKVSGELKATITRVSHGLSSKIGRLISIRNSADKTALSDNIHTITEAPTFDTFVIEPAVTSQFQGNSASGVAVDYALVPALQLSVSQTFIDDDWQFRVPPFDALYGNDAPDDIFDAEFYFRTKLNAKFENQPMDCSLETFEFDWRTLFQGQEINKLKIQHNEVNRTGDKKAKVNMKLTVFTRDNPALPFRESSIIAMDKQLVNERIWHFRNSLTPGVGKFIKFRIEWENVEDFYVDELYALAMILKVPQPDDKPDR